MAVIRDVSAGQSECERLREENERLREFVVWIETWASNPASAYSVAAIDGLFAMVRDRLRVLNTPR